SGAPTDSRAPDATTNMIHCEAVTADRRQSELRSNRAENVLLRMSLRTVEAGHFFCGNCPGSASFFCGTTPLSVEPPVGERDFSSVMASSRNELHPLMQAGSRPIPQHYLLQSLTFMMGGSVFAV